MYFLAPLVLAVALSAALYKTQEVWNKTAFELYVNPTKEVVADVAALRQRVLAGQMSAEQAEVLISKKYETA